MNGYRTRNEIMYLVEAFHDAGVDLDVEVLADEEGGECVDLVLAGGRHLVPERERVLHVNIA